MRRDGVKASFPFTYQDVFFSSADDEAYFYEIVGAASAEYCLHKLNLVRLTNETH